MSNREKRQDARFDERELAPGVVANLPRLHRVLRRGLNIAHGSDDIIERAATELTKNPHEWIDVETEGNDE